MSQAHLGWILGTGHQLTTKFRYFTCSAFPLHSFAKITPCPNCSFWGWSFLVGFVLLGVFWDFSLSCFPMLFKQLISEHLSVKMKTCFQWEKHLHSFQLTTPKFCNTFTLSVLTCTLNTTPDLLYSQFSWWTAGAKQLNQAHCVILATCSAEKTWPYCIFLYHIHQKPSLFSKKCLFSKLKLRKPSFES